MTSRAGERNAYTCQVCNGRIITVHADDGVTPMFLACRADTPGCDGRMVSGMYRPVDGLAMWEWYKPTRRAVKRLDPPMRQHVEAGGLILRLLPAGSVDVQDHVTGV